MRRRPLRRSAIGSEGSGREQLVYNDLNGETDAQECMDTRDAGRSRRRCHRAGRREAGEVASLRSRDPAAVAAQIGEVVKKYGKAGFETFEKAAGAAREEEKLVLYVFVKPNAASSLVSAVADESLKELVDKFIVARSEITKENADAKALSVSESTLLVLDPNADIAKAKPLLKLTGKKDLKEVRKQLEATLRTFEQGGSGK